MPFDFKAKTLNVFQMIISRAIYIYIYIFACKHVLMKRKICAQEVNGLHAQWKSQNAAEPKRLLQMGRLAAS